MIWSGNKLFALFVIPKSFSNPKGIQLHAMERSAKMKLNFTNQWL